MNRGFSLLELAAVLVAGAVLVGAVFAGVRYVGEWVKQRDAAIFTAGGADMDAKYERRDNNQLQIAITERDRLLKEKEGIEGRQLAAITTLENVHAKKNAERDKEFDDYVADINAGRIVWRDPGAGTGGQSTVCNTGAATTPTGDPGGGQGHDRGGILSGQTQGFLLAEAKRADKVVEKLKLCRGALAIERGAP